MGERSHKVNGRAMRIQPMWQLGSPPREKATRLWLAIFKKENKKLEKEFQEEALERIFDLVIGDGEVGGWGRF